MSKKISVTQIDSLIDALGLIESELSLPLLMTLLVIARMPGLSVNELAEKLNIPQQTASRHVATLQGRYVMPNSKVDWQKYPLISLEVNIDDPRRRALYLSEDGARKVQEIIKIIF